jgi:hypothetical protein
VEEVVRVIARKGGVYDGERQGERTAVRTHGGIDGSRGGVLP